MTKKSRDRRKHQRWLKRQTYAGEFITTTFEEIKDLVFEDMVLFGYSGQVYTDGNTIKYKKV